MQGQNSLKPPWLANWSVPRLWYFSYQNTDSSTKKQSDWWVLSVPLELHLTRLHKDLWKQYWKSPRWSSTNHPPKGLWGLLGTLAGPQVISCNGPSDNSSWSHPWFTLLLISLWAKLVHMHNWGLSLSVGRNIPTQIHHQPSEEIHQRSAVSCRFQTQLWPLHLWQCKMCQGLIGANCAFCSRLKDNLHVTSQMKS